MSLPVVGVPLALLERAAVRSRSRSGPGATGGAWLGAAASALALLGCTAAPGSVETVLHPDTAPLAPYEACTVRLIDTPSVSATHVPTCSELTLLDDPPSSGDHYPVWASYGVHEAPIPWGFLIHSMEHGGIVMAYRCEGACPEITGAFSTLVAEHGSDPLCRLEASPARFVVVPDPTLEWPVALVAWEHTYVATCVDLPSMRAFVEAHYDHAPESLCAPGVDRSETGWCP